MLCNRVQLFRNRTLPFQQNNNFDPKYEIKDGAPTNEVAINGSLVCLVDDPLRYAFGDNQSGLS